MDGASGSDYRSDFDIALHLQRAGKHDCFGINGVDTQDAIGRTELGQQPAGVIDPAGTHQGVEQRLIIAAVGVVSQKPAEAIGARTLVLDETFGQVHEDLAPATKPD